MLEEPLRDALAACVTEDTSLLEELVEMRRKLPEADRVGRVK